MDFCGTNEGNSALTNYHECTLGVLNGRFENNPVSGEPQFAGLISFLFVGQKTETVTAQGLVASKVNEEQNALDAV